MLDDVIDFFKANAGEKYVPIEPYEYPSVDPDNKVEESDETNNKASKIVPGAGRPETPASQEHQILLTPDTIKSMTFRESLIYVQPDGKRFIGSTWWRVHYTHDSIRRDKYEGDSSEIKDTQWYLADPPEGVAGLGHDPIKSICRSVKRLDNADKLLGDKVIGEHKCVGFEISASKYGGNPAEWIDCVWFDTETKLPVRILKRGRPVTGLPEGWVLTIVQDQFEYK
jgi:hypothetical protein